MTQKVEWGVSPFEGVFGQSWYGWAHAGDKSLEGGIRRIKMLARLDAWKLARKLEQVKT